MRNTLPGAKSAQPGAKSSQPGAKSSQFFVCTFSLVIVNIYLQNFLTIYFNVFCIESMENIFKKDFLHEMIDI